MNVYDFLDRLNKKMENDKEAFKANLVYDENKFLRDLSFCEWVDIYFKWMEFSTREDCNNFYGED
jgi:hypothetical protein